MHNFDKILNAVLKEMGVDSNKPPHWMPHVRIVRDQTTGKTEKKIGDGYLCSYCGKLSYLKKEKCSGCDSIMLLGEAD